MSLEYVCHVSNLNTGSSWPLSLLALRLESRTHVTGSQGLQLAEHRLHKPHGSIPSFLGYIPIHPFGAVSLENSDQRIPGSKRYDIPVKLRNPDNTMSQLSDVASSDRQVYQGRKVIQKCTLTL